MNGFSRTGRLLKLLGNSLLVSILASFIATVFGTVSAVGIHNLNPKMRKVAMTLTDIPMTNPDIVTGVSLSLLFVFVGTKLLGQRNSLTFWTLLIAHITFNLPYVILNVMPKLKQMDASLTDAAMDLGCTPWQAFFKVTLHEIMPGVVSGAIMAFTMSLDDFVISYFVTGTGFCNPACGNLYLHEKAHSAQDLRHVHIAVLADLRADDRHEPHAAGCRPQKNRRPAKAWLIRFPKKILFE